MSDSGLSPDPSASCPERERRLHGRHPPTPQGVQAAWDDGWWSAGRQAGGTHRLRAGPVCQERAST